jgi:hypothetical protein
MIMTKTRPLSLAYRRPASESERASLQSHRDALEPNRQADRAEVLAGFGLGAVTLLVVGPLVLLAIWALEFATGLAFATPTSLTTAAVLWLLGWGLTGVRRVMSARATLRQQRRDLDDDLREGYVVEESWRFVEAIAWQEAEKLPLHYVLTADDGTRVAFEEERLMGRARQGGEPVASAAPSDAVIVRGLHSGGVLSESYSGPVLPILEVRGMGRRGKPEHGEVVGSATVH